ncbi:MULTISPECIES: response regulator [Stenotrophomonas]|jgi:CheY-like chemotaxis protein|uniref:response regulator n=1 Tax=Stenotrophomonas TaxID=40323 RepID=UPI000D3AA09C|nr:MULTISPECIES: response regulator [Stenotrophomonas]PTS78797.1 response regulator [Stenotrophomonas sp. HMWF023]CAH0137351.1 Chemotaxis response regulator protein-glutamate methylesterase [Stenotrophomonas lactitubi]CAH0171034.1 Chemotaxis response regulator protein-glutamate methylesterase [Stenotrophomonas lactitubi]CAH0193870.1 Chemotaxis response regulator protein-glutamate methylesterase [Stenotrophomonas lactitubi]CAH0196387.1 Chemotaxis response regulator protein-glutamate methylester
MSALQDLRVLVVENDEMSAALLQMQLVQSGALVVGLAASVAEALRLLEEAAPDVALLDYRLAHNETSEPVAAALAARGVPFVLATGMAAEQLPVAMQSGVLLIKPYLSVDLSKALVRAVGRSSANV